MFLIPAVVIFLVAVILLVEPEEKGISRAAAYKAAALSVAKEEEIRSEAASQRSYFPASDQGQWYVKYMDYLYRHGYLTEELVAARAGEAEGLLTYGEARELAGRISEELADAVSVTKRKAERHIPESVWWELFEQICAATEEGAMVKEETLQIYGTPDNVDGAPAWTDYPAKVT